MKSKTITLLAITTLMAVGCKKESENKKPENEKVKDTIQVVTTEKENKASYHKLVTAKNISFDVSTTGKGSLKQLTIKPSGLELNSEIHLDIEGEIVNTEIADLNSDQFPEVLIYTTSAGSGSYGSVIAYSTNKGKSLSQITFPETAGNSKIGKGYMGHDKFSLEGNTLVQEFPIYKKEDPNCCPTGGTRHIQYKLEKGEASEQFIIDKVTENLR